MQSQSGKWCYCHSLPWCRWRRQFFRNSADPSRVGAPLLEAQLCLTGFAAAHTPPLLLSSSSHQLCWHGPRPLGNAISFFMRRWWEKDDSCRPLSYLHTDNATLKGVFSHVWLGFHHHTWPQRSGSTSWGSPARGNCTKPHKAIAKLPLPSPNSCISTDTPSLSDCGKRTWWWSSLHRVLLQIWKTGWGFSHFSQTSGIFQPADSWQPGIF